MFTPLIGARRANGWGGRVIDILAIFATLFGSAASLGLGALQIGSGLKVLGWMDGVGTGLLVVIITVLTLAFVLSAVSGIAKGVQMLSNINMVLAVILAVFVFVVGPTVLVLNLVPTSLASFLGQLPQLAGRTEASSGAEVGSWLRHWTVFYWAWWISWTPFVGMFIARISRGRTIRQFIGGVILVPSVVSLVWFAVFGGSAMKLQATGQLGGAGTPEGQLFDVLHQYPLATAMSILVMLLIGGGSGDALTGLQNLTILVAVPFMVVMIAMCGALLRDLRSDPLIVRGRQGAEAVERAVIAGHERYDGDFAFRIGPGGNGNANGDGGGDRNGDGEAIGAGSHRAGPGGTTRP